VNGAEIIRDLPLEERATWGSCSTCGARHGQRCRAAEASTEVGVHIGRLRTAPVRVRMVPIFSALPAVKSNAGDLWVAVAEIRGGPSG